MKSYRKILSLSLLSLAFASRFYYGAGLGLGQNDSSDNLKSLITSDAGHVIRSGFIYPAGKSFQALGFVGFSGRMMKNLTGSIQADIGYDDLNKTIYYANYDNTYYNPSNDLVSNSQTYSLSFKSGVYYGLSSRIMMHKGDYATYLVAGVRSGVWDFYPVFQSSLYPLLNTKNQKSYNIVAPELGMGVNLTYYDCVDARMEWKYFFGDTVKFNHFASSGVADVVIEDNIKVRQQSLQLSLVF